MVNGVARLVKMCRICSTDHFFNKRCYELINFLALRGHSRRLLKREVNRVRNISRQEALKPRQQKNLPARTPFLITFNPALPSASATVRKNLNILHSSARCKQTFSPPPVVAYKRTPNLRDLLVRTQLRDNTNPQQKAPLAFISVITLAASPARSYKKAKLNILSLQLKKNDV